MVPVFHPLATPFGDLGAAFAEDGRLLKLVRLHGAPIEPPLGPEPRSLPFLKRQLEAYFSGNLRDFNIPMQVEGTEFQRRVWKELTKIPYGQAISYLELARRLGDEKCLRAAARANGANSISILIPCHRVIRATGGAGGYRWGAERKRAMLAAEAGEGG